MIDRTLITRKMNLITQDLNELGPLARKELGEYLGSRIDEVLAERYLERIIGRLIDINYHLITESGHPPPKDYYDFAQHVAACAGLRNRLVHEYDEIDPARVYDGLQAAVRDFPQYLAKIQQYFDGLPQD